MRTIQIPVTPDRPDELLEAMDQYTDAVRMASVLLPGIVDPGKTLKQVPKTSKRIYNGKEQKGVVLRLAQSGRFPLLQKATLLQLVRSTALGNFRSAVSNWESRLRRTENHVLATKYHLWQWIGQQIAVDPNNWPGGRAVMASYDSMLGGRFEARHEIVKRIKETRKQINRRNRPVYAERLPIELHGQQVIYRSQDDAIEFRVGSRNAGVMPHSLRVLPSRRRYQEKWIDLWQCGVYDHGASRVRYDEKDDRWYLHLVLKRDVSKWDEKDPRPLRYIGLHGGIYRPLTWVVFDEDGAFVDQGCHKGKRMIALWRKSDQIVSRLQKKYRSVQRWVFCPDHDDSCVLDSMQTWKKNSHETKRVFRNERGTWKRATKKGNVRGLPGEIRDLLKDMDGDSAVLHRYLLSNSAVSLRERRLGLRRQRRRQCILDELHNATLQLSQYIDRDPEHRYLVFYHDWTFIRDKSMRLKHMWGPDRDAIPEHVRRMGAMWPFAQINSMIEYKLAALENVQTAAVSPKLACTTCSICGGAGKHADRDSIGREHEHWHCWFACESCDRVLNADINAARIAVFMAMAWARGGGSPTPKMGELSKWLRDLDVAKAVNWRPRKGVMR
ncbi:hypothetical protein LCGC14_0621350 [marine sediment metagenome]|uniref:Cas12f1-like TNB domain-containing protein n=1 Tax=marine sediment metagenome TaxID=412755 RepID=A0A0F9UD98_9ZZZZ